MCKFIYPQMGQDCCLDDKGTDPGADVKTKCKKDLNGKTTKELRTLMMRRGIRLTPDLK